MDDSTQHNHDQLAIYRTTLRHLLDQAAKFGGEDRLPTHLMHELRDTRAMIATLKAGLRDAGVIVIDAPADITPDQPDALSAQALLDTMPLDVVPDLASIQPFSRMPYAPNPHFVGRDDALLALAQALKDGGRVALGPRAAATGLGGKSNLDWSAWSHRREARPRDHDDDPDGRVWFSVVVTPTSPSS